MGTLEGNGLIIIEQNGVELYDSDLRHERVKQSLGFEKLVNLFRHIKLSQKKFFSEL